MSLTSQLNDQKSELWKWLVPKLNVKAAEEFRVLVDSRLQRCKTIKVKGSDYTVVGTAIDYAFRFIMKEQQADELIARRGALLLQPIDLAIQMVDQLTGIANDAVADLVLGNEAFITLAQACVGLTYFEKVFRSGEIPVPLHQLDKYEHIQDYLEFIGDTTPTVTDTALLAAGIIPTWKDAYGEPVTTEFIMNPHFTGSWLVGGADADWVHSRKWYSGQEIVLYECKCTQSDILFRGLYLLQAILYAVLDTKDQYKVDHIGWYFPRQKTRIIKPLGEIVEMLFGKIQLADLREDFFEYMRIRAPKPKGSKKLFYGIDELLDQFGVLPLDVVDGYAPDFD